MADRMADRCSTDRCSTGRWGRALCCFSLGLGLVGLGTGDWGLGKPAVAQAKAGGTAARLAQALPPQDNAPESKIYQPLPLRSGELIEDILTTQDIPMGQGSFARDYAIQLEKDDQVAIDLTSESFDTVVTLMAENGTTLGENDDGPDGGTNSLLFMRITQSGEYIVRVRGFGQAKGGPFKLQLTRLKAAQ